MGGPGDVVRASGTGMFAGAEVADGPMGLLLCIRSCERGSSMS